MFGKIILLCDLAKFFKTHPKIQLDMINIFEVFLPQLLRYPNPTDPLNGEAAAMLMREPKKLNVGVKIYF